MLQVMVYTAVGIAVVAVLIAIFIRSGAGEEASNPRRAEALMVERSGDPALINLYYKARTDAERAEIAGFARAAQPPEAPAEAPPAVEEDLYDDDEAVIEQKRPGLLEKRRAKAEARAAAAAEAAAVAANKVTVRSAGDEGETYDDFQSAIAAALRKLEGETEEPLTPPTVTVPLPMEPPVQPVALEQEEAEGILFQPREAIYRASAPPDQTVTPQSTSYDIYVTRTGVEPQVAVPSAVSPAILVSEGNHCAYCGAELERGCKFCIICGMPTQDREAPATTVDKPEPVVPAPAQLYPEPDPFADRSATAAARPLPEHRAVQPEAVPVAEQPAPAAGNSDDQAVYSLEEILKNVRQLEKRINREEDGGIGNHDEE